MKLTHTTKYRSIYAVLSLAVLATMSTPFLWRWMAETGDVAGRKQDSAENPFSYRIPHQDHSSFHAIASLDDISELQNDTSKYRVTGLFTDPSLSEIGISVGSIYGRQIAGDDGHQFRSALTTCDELSAQGCMDRVGTIRIKDVRIRSKYVIFWARPEGSADEKIGVKLFNGGTTAELISWSEGSCRTGFPSLAEAYWHHIDVSALRGEDIDILIYDIDDSYTCASIDFGYVYQSDLPHGSFAGVASPVPSSYLDSDKDGVVDARDAYPQDQVESSDRDYDGTGDNADFFPDDPTETTDSDRDGVGDNSDAHPTDATVTFTVTSLTLHQEGTVPENIIATFDEPLAIQVDTERYRLSGMFADKSIATAGWEGRPRTARIGKASVSTCIGHIVFCGQVVGSIRIRNVPIHSKYMNFLMAGGTTGNTRTSKDQIGVKLYQSGTTRELASYKPEIGVPQLSPHPDMWSHFEVSALNGQFIDIYIYDQDTDYGGYVVFDHFYQGNVPQGRFADTARKPVQSEAVEMSPTKGALP